jgi:hypothetical protein
MRMLWHASARRRLRASGAAHCVAHSGYPTCILCTVGASPAPASIAGEIETVKPAQRTGHDRCPLPGGRRCHGHRTFMNTRSGQVMCRRALKLSRRAWRVRYARTVRQLPHQQAKASR